MVADKNCRLHTNVCKILKLYGTYVFTTLKDTTLKLCHFILLKGTFQMCPKIKINNWFMLNVRISSCGCTREVWRAREKCKSCSRHSREQLLRHHSAQQDYGCTPALVNPIARISWLCYNLKLNYHGKEEWKEINLPEAPF